MRCAATALIQRCALLLTLTGRGEFTRPRSDTRASIPGNTSTAGMNTDAELKQAVQSLGLQLFRRHIFLCADQTEPHCCTREAGLEAWEYLKRRLKELKLAGPEPLVYRTKANC